MLAKKITDSQIESEILEALAGRAEESSACPSEIARALASAECEAWRALMPRIRHVLGRLVQENRVVVTRGSRMLAPDDFGGGPIRIRRGSGFRMIGDP